jgi:uncharacterized protein YkwD
MFVSGFSRGGGSALPGYGYDDERSEYSRRWSDDGYVAVAEPRSYSGGIPAQRYPQYADGADRVDRAPAHHGYEAAGRPSLYEYDALQEYDEPEKPRRKVTKVALIAGAVVALLVVGLGTFAGAILLGGAGGGKTADRTNAAADTGTDVVPSGDAGNGLPVLPSDATTPDATPSTTPGAKTTTTPAAPPSAKKKPPVVKTTKPPNVANLPAEAAVLSLVNSERAKAGCKAVTNDSRLATAARKHSADMVARDYFSHTTPDGVDFATRIENEGYRWSNAGENIASGQRNATEVMKAWMNSPGHRANILNCNFKNLGVGMVLDGNRPMWTQDFGTER